MVRHPYFRPLRSNSNSTPFESHVFDGNSEFLVHAFGVVSCLQPSSSMTAKTSPYVIILLRRLQQIEPTFPWLRAYVTF